jgi:hypothetical protein
LSTEEEEEEKERREKRRGVGRVDASNDAPK